MLRQFAGPEVPDFQPFVDMPLGVPAGLGSAQICDDGVPAGEANGGVPVATGFGDVDALKDLACRFAVLSPSDEACTINSFGNFAFAAPQTFKQFCASIGLNLKFQTGDTKVRMRASTSLGDPGDEAVLIIRVP